MVRILAAGFAVCSAGLAPKACEVMQPAEKPTVEDDRHDAFAAGTNQRGPVANPGRPEGRRRPDRASRAQLGAAWPMSGSCRKDSRSSSRPPPAPSVSPRSRSRTASGPAGLVRLRSKAAGRARSTWTGRFSSSRAAGPERTFSADCLRALDGAIRSRRFRRTPGRRRRVPEPAISWPARLPQVQLLPRSCAATDTTVPYRAGRSSQSMKRLHATALRLSARKMSVPPRRLS